MSLNNMNNVARVLVVALDPGELPVWQEAFSQVESPGGIHFCTNATEALTCVADSEIEIVFAQSNLAPLSAVQLLDDIWEQRPASLRFLSSSSVNKEVMVRCVMGAHQILHAVEAGAIRQALERARVVQQLIENRNLQALVSRMRTLPSRPSIHVELMRELRSSSASTEAVAAVVAKDFAIASKLIQVVNSAFYGLERHVSEVADAVLLLGMDTTSSVALSIEAFARFDKIKPIYFSVEEVWKHSQTVAHAARGIAQHMTGSAVIAADAFTAGLLHDIGKLALALNFEEQYRGAMNLARKNQLSACEVETEVFGANHAEIGAYLLSLWGLPLPIIKAVAEHHSPAHEQGPEFNAGTALHLAEKLQFEYESKRSGTDAVTDLDYPPDLDLESRIDAIRAIVSGSPLPESEGTMHFLKPVEVSKSEAAESRTTIAPEGLLPIYFRQLLPLAVAASVAITAILATCYHFRSPDPGPVAISSQQPPFAEPVDAAKEETPLALQSLKLQAIIYKGSSSSLLINGQSLHIGDEIDGARITAVERSSILVEKAGAQRKIEL
jgi:putative nucleotidyltransferase with HDIG domain